ncbi:MAG: T9SS type A sorting domain-containing protein [Bacteroidales bacterium]|nr:T9SS type A sorting domain-containing protein [Bacteroidales bacterium]
MKKIYLFFVLILFSYVTFSQITWDGSASNDWQTAANWSSNTVPTAGSNVIIANAGTLPVIDDGATLAVCNNLTINSGAVLTVATNGRLTVSGTVTNNAGASGFVIKSDATGDGSVIVNNSFAATIERYMFQDEWEYFAIPITASNTSLFSSINFLNYVESIQDSWLGSNYGFVGGTSGWQDVSGALSSNQGYLYYSTGSSEQITYTGNLNFQSSPTVLTVGYTEHTGTPTYGSVYSDFDGWNILGNSYTSAIDWLLVTKTNTKMDVTYYNGSNYVSYHDNGNGTGLSNGGSQYIPAQQSFFVKTDNTSGGTISIPNSAKVHDETAFWKKNQKDVEQNILRINLDFGLATDQVLIRCYDGATLGYDTNDDGIKTFSPDEEFPQIYSLADGYSSGLWLNSIPLESTNMEIPLCLRAADNAELTLNFSNDFVFDSIQYIYIEDLYEDTVFQSISGGSYSFTHTTGMVEDRFVIHFVVNEAPVVVSNLDNQSVFSDSLFFLDASGVFEDYDIFDEITYSSKLYDGQELPSWLVFDSSTQTFSGTPANNDIGTYEIELFAVDSYDDSSSVTFDVVVNQNVNVFENTDAILIYPNPTNGILNLSSNFIENGVILEIIDFSGRVILQKEVFGSGYLKVDISDQPTGIYFLRMIKKSGKEVTKIIIKK